LIAWSPASKMLIQSAALPAALALFSCALRLSASRRFLSGFEPIGEVGEHLGQQLLVLRHQADVGKQLALVFLLDPGHRLVRRHHRHHHADHVVEDVERGQHVLEQHFLGQPLPGLLADRVVAGQQERQLEVLGHQLGEIPLGDMAGVDQHLHERLAELVLGIERVGDRLRGDGALLRQQLGQADGGELFQALHRCLHRTVAVPGLSGFSAPDRQCGECRRQRPGHRPQA